MCVTIPDLETGAKQTRVLRSSHLHCTKTKYVNTELQNEQQPTNIKRISNPLSLLTFSFT